MTAPIVHFQPQEFGNARQSFTQVRPASGGPGNFISTGFVVGLDLRHQAFGDIEDGGDVDLGHAMVLSEQDHADHLDTARPKVEVAMGNSLKQAGHPLAPSVGQPVHGCLDALLPPGRKALLRVGPFVGVVRRHVTVN